MKWKAAIIVVPLLAAVGGAAYIFGKSAEQLPMSDSIVARIGERDITVQNFVDEMAARGGHVPGQYQRLDQRRALLDAMIEQELLVLGAIESGLDQDPEVRRAIRRILLSRYRDQLLEEKLADVDVTEAEVAAYYQLHQDDYIKPERRRAALIFAEVGSKASDDTRVAARDRLKQARSRLTELEPGVHHFGPLAIEYSDDRSTRYLGGVIGWLMASRQDRYKWDEAVIESIFSMTEPGEVSEVIETSQGYYLARLVALELEQPQALTALAPALKRILVKQKMDEARQHVFDSIKSGIQFEVNDAVLAAIEPLSSPSTGRLKPPAIPQTSNGN